MPYTSDTRSNSILETSLTELAFIFFFILAIFSSWKVNSSTEQLKRQEEKNKELSSKVSDLNESLAVVAKLPKLGNKIDPEKLFNELVKGKEAQDKLKDIQNRNSKLESDLKDFTSILGKPNKESLQDIVEKLKEYEKISKVINENKKLDGKNISDKVKGLAKSVTDIKGRNAHLVSRLDTSGNGLDHQPCWADSKGRIQYIFNIVINETNIRIVPGWPQSRANEAKQDFRITKIPGKYTSNSEMWRATQDLFNESEEKNCRHFVRIYDHSISKNVFKSYLTGIESHFYKYLSNARYNGRR